MTIEIDKARALRLLEEAVAERGESYLYGTPDGSCVYVTKDGQPSCGVGLALAKAGVPADVLAYIDYNRDGAYESNRFDETQIDALDIVDYLREKDVVIEAEAAEVFRTFQREQDLEIPWGAALDEAKGQNGV